MKNNGFMRGLMLGLWLFAAVLAFCAAHLCAEDAPKLDAFLETPADLSQIMQTARMQGEKNKLQQHLSAAKSAISRIVLSAQCGRDHSCGLKMTAQELENVRQNALEEVPALSQLSHSSLLDDDERREADAEVGRILRFERSFFQHQGPLSD